MSKSIKNHFSHLFRVSQFEQMWNLRIVRFLGLKTNKARIVADTGERKIGDVDDHHGGVSGDVDDNHGGVGGYVDDQYGKKENFRWLDGNDIVGLKRYCEQIDKSKIVF